MNIFTSIVATYTDKGSGAAGALTGRTTRSCTPAASGPSTTTAPAASAGSTAGGDPGVQEEATQDVGGGNNVGFIENGDYIYFNRMNFENLTRVDFRVASGGAGGKIELRMDSPTGATFASADVAPTGGWQNWTTVSAPITNPPQGHARALRRLHPPDRHAAA